jgi:hypothetical protein
MSAKNFLNKYCPKWSQHDFILKEFKTQAARNSISAAVKRNKTFRKDIDVSRKEELRDTWIKHLIDIDFYKIRNLNQLNEVYDMLGSSMNETYIDSFHDKFRLAHAQKSISVYWKYLYCYSQLTDFNVSKPIVIPLDRIVQNECGLRYNEILAWGKMDDFNLYCKQLALISDRVKVDLNDLIDWEISIFNKD